MEDDFIEELRKQDLFGPPKRSGADQRQTPNAGDDSQGSLRDFLSTTTGSSEHVDTDRTGQDVRLQKLLKHHAPRGWQQTVSPQVLTRLIDQGDPIDMIVLSIDIRKSTRIMRETIDFKKFADIISGFVTSAAQFIRWGNGWFDKFTGDGLLAYWIVEDESRYRDQLESALQSSYHIISSFQNNVLKDLKANAHNFPAGVGMSGGLDSGPTHLLTVAGNLTVVGHPVVGAVRMCDAAENPAELMCNLQVGERILAHKDDLKLGKDFSVMKKMGATKEYDAQEAYLVQFWDLL